MSWVQPVVVLRATFCIFWSLLREVEEMVGDKMVLAYSMMGNIVLYVVMSVSLRLPQCVDVRSRKRLSVLWAFEMALFVWVEKFSLVSKVRPRIVGLMVVRMGVLLYSEKSEVMSVVLVGLILSLLVVAHVWISLRYGWRFWVAVFMLGETTLWWCRLQRWWGWLSCFWWRECSTCICWIVWVIGRPLGDVLMFVCLNVRLYVVYCWRPFR